MMMRQYVGRSPWLFAKVLLGFTAAVWLPLAPWALAQSLPIPPDQGAPTGRQRGGASRGDCAKYQELTALVPLVNGAVWSQTSSPTPDFFFYIPHALTTDILLELVVQDSEDNYVFRRQFSVDAPPGILNVPVSSEGAGLVSGETYRWTFSIYCDEASPSASVSVFGLIQRVASSVAVEPEIEPERRLTSDMQLNLVREYAAAGLWHEAMALTLSLYPTSSGNVEYLETLSGLLESAGIFDIVPTVLVSKVPE